jgi:hypothetical protein
MRFLLRKIDSLAGAFVAALGALGCAQLPVFVQQYLQRLGGHVDEARRQVAQLTGADAARSLDGATRLALETLARARLVALESQHQALSDAAPTLRPLAFLRGFDGDIAAATLDRFVPALPLDTAGMIYAGAGLVAGWLVYEGVKLPVWAVWRMAMATRRRRRPADA